MFALSDLVAAAGPEPSVSEVDVTQISGKEFRFPLPGVSPVRLPADLRSLAEMLDGAGADAGPCWRAITSPTHRVPLESLDGFRRFALVAACSATEMASPVAAVQLTVRLGTSRAAPGELCEQQYSIAHDTEGALDILEALWAEAYAAARAAEAGESAVFLAGAPAQLGPSGVMRVQGVCASLGLRAEVVVEANRHVRQVASRLGSRPPDYLIVWSPHARGTDAAISAFQSANSEGELVILTESAIADARLELRWALLEHGLDRPPSPQSSSVTRPTPGEQRYYIKFRGSGAGDVMIEVPDCGHDQWESDQRRKAPRALKGITNTVGVTPRALFLCRRCNKHRWRARY